MCIPTLVFMKLADGFRSFLDIFLLIHRSNRMQSAVSLQALFLAFFSSFARDLEIFTSECTPCVSQPSFSWNQLMDLVHFWIYSCLYIVVTICKTLFGYKHYFLHFSLFCLGHRNIYWWVHPMCIPTLISMKPADGFRSFLDIFLFIHSSNSMQNPVSLQALFLAFFPSFAWHLEIFTNECIPSVFQHSFSCNKMMYFVHFCIYSFMHVLLLPVPKEQLRCKHYFSHLPIFIYYNVCVDKVSW